MKKGRIIIISGPSGSGKTTLHTKLLLSRRLKKKLVKSVSMTTRARRSNETEGRDYLFVSKKDFLAKRKKNYFLEWQKVFDNYYGTPKEYVETLLKNGRNVLLCIDVKGAKVVARQYPDALKIFINAPSWDELKKRLVKRGTERKGAFQLRLKIARREMREARRYNYVLMNDDLKKAFRELESIILSEI